MSRLAVVLWSGVLGGAETFTTDLCREMRTRGADVGVVFITHGYPLVARLEADGIDYTSLELDRGREIIRHPRALAKAVDAMGVNGALVPRAGYLTAALRLGGYRGRVVAVAHDALLALGLSSFRERSAWRLDRLSGFWASDVDVAVSEFALRHMRRQPHAKQLTRIYNAVDLEKYSPPRRPTIKGRGPTIGAAGRLVKGKGFDFLLRAFAAGPAASGAQLRIAGQGPMQTALEDLARQLGVAGSVEFTGPVLDMASYWRASNIAVQPTTELVESFGMAAVEAMASGRPAVVTANGALPEIVADGVTGAIVDAGDVSALAKALVELVSDEGKRHAAGAAARLRCEELFDLRDCAAAYLRLFEAA